MLAADREVVVFARNQIISLGNAESGKVEKLPVSTLTLRSAVLSLYCYSNPVSDSPMKGFHCRALFQTCSVVTCRLSHRNETITTHFHELFVLFVMSLVRFPRLMLLSVSCCSNL